MVDGNQQIKKSEGKEKGKSLPFVLVWLIYLGYCVFPAPWLAFWPNGNKLEMYWEVFF